MDSIFIEKDFGQDLQDFSDFPAPELELLIYVHISVNKTKTEKLPTQSSDE
jgi:hypothetical protein